MIHLHILLHLIRCVGSSIGARSYRILVLGGQNSGKTQLTYRLCGHVGERFRVPEPTQGIHETSTELDGQAVTFVEIGGADRMLPIWRQFLRQADGVIYVVNFADSSCWSSASDRLQNLLLTDRGFKLNQCPLLILANKLDLANHGAPVIQLVRELRLCRVRHHRWHVEGVSAIKDLDRSLEKSLRLLLAMVHRNRRRMKRLRRLEEPPPPPPTTTTTTTTTASV